MPLIQVAGHRLEYEWIGSRASGGPTLVFLHEGLGSVSLWRDFPAALCRRTSCSGLVYSRWGHGASDPLDAFGIRRPILVGHSDGGSIALIYEGSRIGQSAGLILEAPHVFVEDLTVKSIARIETLYEQSDLRSRLARYHGERVDPLFRAWTGVWLSPEFRSWNIEEYLPGVLAPTLILQGLDDEYGTEKQVETIARILGERCESLMLPACGHTPHMGQRSTAEAAMAAFVARVR